MRISLTINTLVVLLAVLLTQSSAEQPVLILNDNSQVLTSTTLEWVSFNAKTKKNFENAVVGGYVKTKGELCKNNLIKPVELDCCQLGFNNHVSCQWH